MRPRVEGARGLVLAGMALTAPAAVAAPPEPLVPLRATAFSLPAPGEAVAEIRVRCARCDWGRRGREAAVLRLTLDGRYSQHVVAARGSARYRVALGPLEAGEHRLEVALERRLSCRGVGTVAVEQVGVDHVPPGTEGYEAASRSPFLYLRPDALERFTDVPLLMWYEEEPAPGGGGRLRYSVVFSNEDGGTPPDRLMATWGRVTDIEYVYGVEIDAAGRLRREEFQGREHRLLPFDGRSLGRHPLLWVRTDNNMLETGGPATVRVAPAAFPFSLAGVSREAVMDAHPWTYQVSAAEVRRERRVSAEARPGSARIPDPRRYAYLEACTEPTQAALAFAVGLRGPGGAEHWVWSDAGGPRWRISRNPDHFPNGCFRGAVPLPPGAGAGEVVGLRFRSFPRERREGEPPPSPEAGRARLRRVNRLFMLAADDTPGPVLYAWEGDEALVPGAPPLELRVMIGP